MQFVKMHGAGNDYLYVNCFAERVDDPVWLARKVSDRHFGIGADGLVLICRLRRPMRAWTFTTRTGRGRKCAGTRYGAWENTRTSAGSCQARP